MDKDHNLQSGSLGNTSYAALRLMVRRSNMERRKILFRIVLPAVLAIGVINLGIIMAYLNHSTGVIRNTLLLPFISDDAGPQPEPEPVPEYLADSVIIDEAEAEEKPDSPGEYDLTDNRVDRNDYTTIIPGRDVPKEARVNITKLKKNAYLFVEVLDTTPEAITWEINDCWILLEGVTGSHNGKIYVLDTALEPYEETEAYEIIKDNTVHVLDSYSGDSTSSIVFYAYLLQSDGFSSGSEAWQTIMSSQG